VVAIVLVGWYLLGTYTNLKLPGFGGGSLAKSNDWQAVFLSNGQVYFGKIKSVNKEILTLNDIYYLQVVTKPLQRTQEGAVAQTQQQQELTLIKLGNELHGPTDEMRINREQILLVENLKSDSSVVDAIRRFKETGETGQ